LKAENKLSHSKKKKKNIFPIVVITIFLVVASGFVYYAFWFPYQSRSNAPKVVSIAKNSSVKQIAKQLYDSDIISNDLAFIIVVKVMGMQTKLLHGTYTFNNNLSNIDVLNMLVAGAPIPLVKITIREGLTIKQMASLIHNKYQMDSAKFLSLINNKEFIKESLKLDIPNLEGYLFPNTYILEDKPSEKKLIHLMVNEIKKIFNDSLIQIMNQKKLNIHSVLTMASIIEGESRKEDERAKISGVYHNRLKKQMPLEADPTVQYSISDGPRRLFFRDYKTVSPYNTYLHYGLPPGPINNPGLNSILAAIDPEEHNYLFFVADGTGGHFFTTTFSDHKKAIREIRKKK
jgi:UPF0755 protein